MLVQRIIGSKKGTGGSSGYHYLSSTARFEVILDILALAFSMFYQFFVSLFVELFAYFFNFRV